jgi:hypothetical protein
MKLWGFVLGAALACTAGASHAGESVYTAPEGFWLPDANATRDSAAGFAIATAMTINAVAQRCMMLDADRAHAASAARDAWWARNQLLVETANGYVRYLQAIRQVKRGEEAANAFYTGVFAELRTQSEAEVAKVFASASANGDAAVCDRTTSAYADGRMDLSKDADHSATLAAMDQDLRAYRAQ